jgi:hypothetical protein
VASGPERARGGPAFNLVVVGDAERLARAGPLPPLRIIVCGVEPGRAVPGAGAIAVERALRRERGDFTVAGERVQVALGEDHLARLDTIVAPLLAPGRATVAWCPHAAALPALGRLADAVVVDSDDGAFDARVGPRVVDLAWLRTAPWRERIAALFDPPAERSLIEAVHIRHHPASERAAVLVLGWLSARLGRLPGAPALEADAEAPARGITRIGLTSGSGRSVVIERGRRGLLVRERPPDGPERRWTAGGPARGEALVLGDGIRGALLPDPAFAAALTRSSDDLVLLP